MFTKTFFSLVVLAASVAAAVPSVNKRATCSNGKTTANDAVGLPGLIVRHTADTDAPHHSAASGLTCSTTFRPTCSLISSSCIDSHSPPPSFHGGQCGEDAHESLRVTRTSVRHRLQTSDARSQLTFHDAIAFSPSLTASGQFG